MKHWHASSFGSRCPLGDAPFAFASLRSAICVRDRGGIDVKRAWKLGGKKDVSMGRPVKVPFILDMKLPVFLNPDAPPLGSLLRPDVPPLRPEAPPLKLDAPPVNESPPKVEAAVLKLGVLDLKPVKVTALVEKLGVVPLRGYLPGLR